MEAQMNKFKVGDRVWHFNMKFIIKHIGYSMVFIDDGLYGIAVPMRELKPIIKIKNGVVYE